MKAASQEQNWDEVEETYQVKKLLYLWINMKLNTFRAKQEKCLPLLQFWASQDNSKQCNNALQWFHLATRRSMERWIGTHGTHCNAHQCKASVHCLETNCTLNLLEWMATRTAAQRRCTPFRNKSYTTGSALNSTHCNKLECITTLCTVPNPVR